MEYQFNLSDAVPIVCRSPLLGRCLLVITVFVAVRVFDSSCSCCVWWCNRQPQHYTRWRAQATTKASQLEHEYAPSETTAMDYTHTCMLGGRVQRSAPTRDERLRGLIRTFALVWWRSPVDHNLRNCTRLFGCLVFCLLSSFLFVVLRFVCVCVCVVCGGVSWR